MIEFIPPSPGTIIITAGLSLDIIGAILITFFGIPKLLTRGGGFIITYGHDENKIRRAKVFDRLSVLGMLFMILGFLGQMIGSWVK